MGDTTPLLDATGATNNVSVDAITTRDGAAAAAGEKVQITKLGWGAENTLTSAAAGQGIPVMQDKFTSVLARSSGLTSTTTSQPGLSANSARRRVFASNGGGSGIWIDFGQAAVAGNGVYLPAHAKDTYETDLSVNFILEAGGTGGPVSFVGV